MIKVHEVSRKYITTYTYYITFNWFTYFVAVNYTACTHSPSSGIMIFLNISDSEIFHAKKFHEILHY